MKDISDQLRFGRHPGGPEDKISSSQMESYALQALKTAVGRYHGGLCQVRESVQWCSRAAVQVVAEFVRVLRIHIEQKAKIALLPPDTISLWMVRWAAIMCSTSLAGHDGWTAYERRKGRRC